MPPEDRDPAYLWDMLDAARSGMAIIDGVDFETFSGDITHKFALERANEIVGERPAE